MRYNISEHFLLRASSRRNQVFPLLKNFWLPTRSTPLKFLQMRSFTWEGITSVFKWWRQLLSESKGVYDNAIGQLLLARSYNSMKKGVLSSYLSQESFGPKCGSRRVILLPIMVTIVSVAVYKVTAWQNHLRVGISSLESGHTIQQISSPKLESYETLNSSSIVLFELKWLRNFNEDQCTREWQQAYWMDCPYSRKRNIGDE